MQFTFSASGSPAEVRESINQQAKAAARGNAALWPAAAAVRDYVAQQVNRFDPEQPVSVSVSVNVSLTGTEKPEPAGKVTSVATGTVGVEGKAVAVVGEDRIIPSVRRLDGQPMVRNAAGLIEGDVITGDGSGEALPPIEAADPNAPMVAGVSEPTAGRRASDRSSK